MFTYVVFYYIVIEADFNVPSTGREKGSEFRLQEQL